MDRLELYCQLNELANEMIRKKEAGIALLLVNVAGVLIAGTEGEASKLLGALSDETLHRLECAHARGGRGT